MNRASVFAIVAGVALVLVGLMFAFEESTVTYPYGNGAGGSVGCGTFFAGPSGQSYEVAKLQDVAAQGSSNQVIPPDVLVLCTPVLDHRTLLVWALFGGGLALAGTGVVTWRRSPAAPPPPANPYPGYPRP